MPRQNRVTPFGDIIATPERGTFLGNRGILHDAEGRIKRAWQGKRWIVCVLEFRGRKRTVMTPNSYTELFFLDEATALAAGHRPCAECRHARFLDCGNSCWKRRVMSTVPRTLRISFTFSTARFALSRQMTPRAKKTLSRPRCHPLRNSTS